MVYREMYLCAWVLATNWPASSPKHTAGHLASQRCMQHGQKIGTTHFAFVGSLLAFLSNTLCMGRRALQFLNNFLLTSTQKKKTIIIFSLKTTVAQKNIDFAVRWKRFHFLLCLSPGARAYATAVCHFSSFFRLYAPLFLSFSNCLNDFCVPVFWRTVHIFGANAAQMQNGLLFC